MTWSMGSSPRVRGSLDDGVEERDDAGIIPAGAGLTRPLVSRMIMSRDHPRGCGAHCDDGLAGLAAQGSSPRVRGSLVIEVEKSVDIGIIPAGAGLTKKLCGRYDGSWDHPRGCGAHEASGLMLYARAGSSPRVRGSLTCPTTEPDFDGIIPAGAGLTVAHLVRVLILADHPRGCGAHKIWTSVRYILLGSSPRVRGSQKVKSITPAKGGIIPAGAGLTLKLSE